MAIEDKIRKLVEVQLSEWMAADLSRRFGHFTGTAIEDLQCNLTKVPDTLFVMMLTAFPGIFYKPKFDNNSDREKILGIFTSMTKQEKDQFVQKVKRKYAKSDILKLKKGLGHTLDIAFPGTSYLVCTQIVVLAKLFGSIFGSEFDFEDTFIEDSDGAPVSAQQAFTTVLQQIAETVKAELVISGRHQRRDALQKFNFESFMIFPSVTEAFAFDRDTGNLDQRKEAFENTVLTTQNLSARDFYYSLTTYYKEIDDTSLRAQVLKLCEPLNLIKLTSNDARAVVSDLDFKCDFAYTDLKRYF